MEKKVTGWESFEVTDWESCWGGPGEPAYRKEVPARIDSLSWSPITNLLAFTGSYIRGDPHSRSYRGNVGIFAPPSYEREGGGWKAMK